MNGESESVGVKHFVEFLETSFRKRVSEFSLKLVQQKDAHYGGSLFTVQVKLSEDGELQDKLIQAIIKTPVTNPFLIKLFQPALTFVKEVRFYTDIIPTIEQYEQSTNIPANERLDAFFQYFGSRISLDPNATSADADAILMLENGVIQNFKNIDRFYGFNIDEILTIIKQVAKLHSLCIAIRLQKPEIFNKKIRPHLNGVNMIIKENDNNIIQAMLSGVSFVDGLDSNLLEKIQKQLVNCHNNFSKTMTNTVADTPYTTIVHRDLWINNIMIKKDTSLSVSIQIKIYDFQLYFYQSFVHDLIFFLCLSVRPNELICNFKMFIDFYHAEFVKTLQFVNVSLEDYTYEKMWSEIKERARVELMHILYMLKIFFVDNASAANANNVSADSFTKHKPSDIILYRWKVVIDLFTQHGFL